MNYEKIYNMLVDKRKKDKIFREFQYCEEHHIIPKSLGGKNDETNLVNFTAREHFVAHKLLVLITEKKYGHFSIEHRKMLQALFFMSNRHNDCTFMTSREYEILRIEYSKSITGEFNNSYNKRGKDSPNYGKKHTDEAKLKNKNSHLGRKHMHHPVTDHDVVVKPELIDEYLAKGYVFGISKHQSAGFSKGRSGTKQMYHPITQQQVIAQPSKVQFYLDHGFVFGRNKKNCQKHNDSMKNRKFMFHPIKNDLRLIKYEDIEKFLADGYILGKGIKKNV